MIKTILVPATGSDTDPATYPDAFRASWVYKDLKRVRNVKPLWSKAIRWCKRSPPRRWQAPQA